MCAWLCGSGTEATTKEIPLSHLNQHATLVFQIWEDSYQRVATQQEIYEGPWQGLRMLIHMPAGEGASQSLTTHAHPLHALSLASGLASPLHLSLGSGKGEGYTTACSSWSQKVLGDRVSRWYQAWESTLWP